MKQHIVPFVASLFFWFGVVANGGSENGTQVLSKTDVPASTKPQKVVEDVVHKAVLLMPLFDKYLKCCPSVGAFRSVNTVIIKKISVKATESNYASQLSVALETGRRAEEKKMKKIGRPALVVDDKTGMQDRKKNLILADRCSCKFCFDRQLKQRVLEAIILSKQWCHEDAVIAHPLTYSLDNLDVFPKKTMHARAFLPCDRSWNLLHLAAFIGDAGLVNCLICHGFPVYEKTAEGLTARDIAEKYGYELVVAILPPTITEVTCLNSWNLLHVAAFNGDEDKVAHLLKTGFSVNAKTSQGETAYRIAQQYGKNGVANVILQMVSEQCCHQGWNQLHIAAFIGDAGRVELLLGNGYGLRKKTLQGETAYDIAKKYKHDAVLNIISRYSDKKRNAQEELKKFDQSHLVPCNGDIELLSLLQQTRTMASNIILQETENCVAQKVTSEVPKVSSSSCAHVTLPPPNAARKDSNGKDIFYEAPFGTPLVLDKNTHCASTARRSKLPRDKVNGWYNPNMKQIDNYYV